MALALFIGAFGVERDEPLEEFLVAEVARPAVGVADSGVERVVDFLQHRDQPLLMDHALLCRERLRSFSSTLYIPVLLDLGCAACRAFLCAPNHSLNSQSPPLRFPIRGREHSQGVEAKGGFLAAKLTPTP